MARLNFRQDFLRLNEESGRPLGNGHRIVSGWLVGGGRRISATVDPHEPQSHPPRTDGNRLWARGRRVDGCWAWTAIRPSWSPYRAVCGRSNAPCTPIATRFVAGINKFPSQGTSYHRPRFLTRRTTLEQWCAIFKSLGGHLGDFLGGGLIE